MSNPFKILDHCFHIIVGIICLLSVFYYIFCGITLGFGISILLVWLIVAILALTDTVIFVFCYKYIKRHKVLNLLRKLLLGVFTVIFIIFLIVEANIVISMNSGEKCSTDCLIILGAGIFSDQPSPVLQSRIDTAYDYLIENPRTIVIVSGGQGPGEKISEGKCIANTLMEKGISENRIIIENQSKTTAESLKFSSILIPDDIRVIGIVTNNFHVFRSVSTAKSFFNCRVFGISAPYSGVLLPHYLMREFITFCVDVALGNISVTKLI